MVFPLAGMKTKDGHECFYIRHSRLHPGQSSVEDAIDPLAYVMNAMCEKEGNTTPGIALISNYAGWKVEQYGELRLADFGSSGRGGPRHRVELAHRELSALL